MFTGLIEALAPVHAVTVAGPGRLLTIALPRMAQELTPGESVAVNGACLTVVETNEHIFSFQAGPETLRLTNLGELQPGMQVNLERSLKVGDRLGGHIVQGHIDGLGRLEQRTRQGDWETLWFSCPRDLTSQMIRKGSIAVDGISLTLVDVTAAGFSVALIPHTLAMTNLGFRQPGETVNLETDLFGKYVVKYLAGIAPAQTRANIYNSVMQHEPETPVRQTQTYLRHLFQERGLRPKNKLGQNFLVDLNLVDFIAKSAELTRHDMVLEVGTGTGTLTALLADQAGAVLSVEIDASFHEIVQETLGRHEHLQFFHGDILKNKNHLNPFVMQRLREGLARFQGKNLKLVANLPYAVATPVVTNLILSDLPIERMVVTVQWEIAERLMASPGSKDYGSLAILMQSLADIELLRKLAPAVFWPRPQVESAIIRIKPNAQKRSLLPDPMCFRIFLRDLYAHRRKNLRSALGTMPSKPMDKPEVDRRLAELGIDGNCRAETLDRHVHLKLCHAFDFFQIKPSE